MDASGKELPIDPEEAKRLADLDVVADDMEPRRKVRLADLDRAYAEHQAKTAVMVAAFDRADPECHQKMATAASQIEATAVAGHVDTITRSVLEQDPDAVAVVVKRDEDPIYGASFRLSHAVRADGARSEVALKELDDYRLQGTALDDHLVSHIELEHRDLEELNIPLRIEEDT